MSYLLTILLIGLLIFLHELGHLLAAKAVGIPIARFSIGFGPVLWSRRIGGVEYCLSAVGLGGYPLDGGKIFCALLEKIHPRLARLQTGFAVAGLVLLLLLMVYTTVLDVVRQAA